MPSIASDVLDDQLSFERLESFAGGEDSFRRSTLLDPDQCQQLVNIIVRDNFEARTRPGADALGGAPVNAGQCQGLLYYDTPLVEQLLAGINGKFWKWEGNAWTQLAAWSPALPDLRLAMAQGVDKVLISDGSGNLQIFDGAAFVDAGATGNDAPKGATILCWHTGRMFASGLATLPDTIYVSNRLDFGAGQWSAATRSFRVGYGDGDPIVALASFQGFTLCVLKRNSIWLCDTDPTNEPADFSVAAADRSNLLAAGIGCVGRDAWCAYGNDILFMAQDGVRSVQRMQAAAGQWQLSAPLSQPIQPYIDRINRGAWDKIVARKYREFAFFFVPLDNSQTNNCVLVWNGRLGKWLGRWTGWNGQSVEVTRFNGDMRFVFGDYLGNVNQWKDFSDVQDDNTYQDNGADIASSLYTRAMLFGDPVCNKSAHTTVLRFTAGNAQVNVTWVADNAAVKNWSAQPQPTGDILGVGVLPFQLQATAPVKMTKGVRGLAAFNEAYLRIESAKGWWFLRNVTCGAFINPLKET